MPPLQNLLYKTRIDTLNKKPVSKPDPIKIGLFGLALLIFLVVLAGLANLTIKSLQKPPPPSIPKSDSQAAIELEKQRQKQASAAAEAAKQPLAKLTKAYEEIVGSKDFLRDISFSNGLGSIRYTINSKDNTTVLTTGYQNFADFASTVFANIPELTNLKLVIYATALVDAQGQANTPAMTLAITRSKNDQINWQNNKYRYNNYQVNLDTNEINSALVKDYETLIKKNQ